MSVQVQLEPIGKWAREAVERGLLEAHWREVDRDLEDIELEPDFDAWFTLDRAGLLASYTVRREGELVGYALFLVHRHLHFKSHKFASCDSIYVARGERAGGGGMQLLRYIVRDLTERGVAKILMHVPIAHDFGPALKLLGFKATETLYELRVS